MITFIADEEVDARSPVRNLLGEARTANEEADPGTMLPGGTSAVLREKRGRRGEEIFALTKVIRF